MADTSDRPVVTGFSVFSGVGMLDTAAELALDALGYGFRALGYVERDAAAAASLLARVANSTLHRAPVWCDCLSRVDARPLRGLVDVLIASPPCQPYSSAGKRRGNADERSHGDGDGSLVHLARIIDESRPAVGFFENVGEWFTDGHFREFGDRLCDLGYECAPPLFVASEDIGGAPHARERVFVMVYEHGTRWPAPGCGYPLEQRGGPDARGGIVQLADRNGGGRETEWRSRLPDRDASRGDDADRRRGGLADAPSDRRPSDQRRRRTCDKPVAADRGNGDPLCPPGRPIFDDELATYARRNRTSLADVRRRIAGSAEALGQWARLAAGGLDPTLMPAVEPGVSVVADALAPSASDLLRIGGNGVDPLVAAHAFRTLWLEAFGGD